MFIVGHLLGMIETAPTLHLLRGMAWVIPFRSAASSGAWLWQDKREGNLIIQEFVTNGSLKTYLTKIDRDEYDLTKLGKNERY